MCIYFNQHRKLGCHKPAWSWFSDFDFFFFLFNVISVEKMHCDIEGIKIMYLNVSTPWASSELLVRIQS